MLAYRRFCGKTVQGYRIEACVGVGGSAVVFKATDPLGRPVALKMLRPLRKVYELEKVWREVEPLNRIANFRANGLPDVASGNYVADSASLISPDGSQVDGAARLAVPEWQGIVREGRAYFIVLSWMPGETLENWLFEKRHRFERAELVCVASQLLEVLVDLHEAGLAQADLRPANILYDGSRISLIDFGLSGGSEDFVLDIAGFADIVLYLLYSTFEPSVSTRSKTAKWYEELPLENSQRELLLRLIEAPQTVEIHDVRAAFLKVFSADR